MLKCRFSFVFPPLCVAWLLCLFRVRVRIRLGVRLPSSSPRVHFRQVIGPSFSESFDVFLPSVLKYTRGSRPASDRAMAVGCFAEVFDSIGP